VATVVARTSRRDKRCDLMGSSFAGIRTMPWRAAAIVARLSWCRNDGDGDFARLDREKT
jgi:hypothetical protein